MMSRFSVYIACIVCQFCSPIIVRSQSDTVPAKYPTGNKGFIAYLVHNMKPEVLTSNGAPAGNYKVEVAFQTDTAGRITKVKASNDPGYGAAAYAEKLIGSSGMWIPATAGGKNVSFCNHKNIVFVVSDQQAKSNHMQENMASRYRMSSEALAFYKDTLHLQPQQLQTISDIDIEYKKKGDSVRTSTENNKSKVSSLMELIKERNKRMQSILTEDQYQKFLKWQSAILNRRVKTNSSLGSK